ncbi:CHC2 zinc finger domain-containing protein [Halomonas sp.]|uniref:CHC2 zinc finger domain-containing protein n=1 Tax=Halomonas sp. TaxID=1486246 RepID=UPI003A92D36C
MRGAIKTPDRSRARKSTVQANNSTRPDVYAILDRLDKVKENGPGRWLACCPAHQDRSPSLAVRETSDGTILMKCFAGCPTGDVLDAIGLELKDLFPQRDNDAYTASKRPGERWVPRDVLAAVAREALIALLAAEAVHSGTLLSDDDRNRLALAAGRLRAAAKEVGAHV